MNCLQSVTLFGWGLCLPLDVKFFSYIIQLSSEVIFLNLNIYTYFKKRRRERRMPVVERKLHDRKELWFPCLVCKNNEFFAWRKTDTAVRTANWFRLNMILRQKFRNIAFHYPFTNAKEKWSLCHWFWRIWTNHMTRHRRSALYGSGLMGDYIFYWYSIPTFNFSRAIAFRQLTFVVLPDNIFWNRCIL